MDAAGRHIGCVARGPSGYGAGMLPAGWIPHRRPHDHEPVGWIRPEGDDWVAVSLLGRDLTGPVDWLGAEEALEEAGLTWLADVWVLELADEPVRVRIVEVSPDGVVVQTDDLGAIDVAVERYALPWPAPAELRPRRADDPGGGQFSGPVRRRD
jgi:hypothetical protein